MSMPAKLTKVAISLPFLGFINVEWEADETEMRAAWALYVELSTRVSTVPLELNQGLLREALTSLHAIFAETRAILRDAGPSIGRRGKSVGGLAIVVLNKCIRPYLAKWHPHLEEWEAGRPAGASRLAHERAWPEEAKARGELNKLHTQLLAYTNALAKIAGVD